MKLIIGLGNPGKQYTNTRHNVGFLSLDSFAKKENLSFKIDTNFKGSVATYNKNGYKAIFLQPLTYMNLSGESVIKVVNYFKIKLEDILVIYDDISIPVGSIRIRENGSSGGHNGIKNLILHLKTQEFRRVRVGVSSNNNIDMKDYVLGNFSKDEKITLDLNLDSINNLILDFIEDVRFDLIMNKYNKKA